MYMNIKRNKRNYEVNVFHSKESRTSSYTNIVDTDPNKLAQILIDLMIQGFPIEKAIKLFREKVEKKDWIGI